MMTTWIHDSEPNHLPHYAGHYIGVGGFVVNERDELLVVQERFSPLGIKHWKLPGGHKDPGECKNTIKYRVVLSGIVISWTMQYSCYNITV